MRPFLAEARGKQKQEAAEMFRRVVVRLQKARDKPPANL
jgi:hypothetical protein